MTPAKSKLKNLLFLMLFIFVSTFVILSILEVTLRVTGLFVSNAFRPSRVPGLMFELRPNATYKADGVKIRVNSAGFRDREFSAAAENNETRVVCLGDSMSMGVGLPLESLYMKRMEAAAKRAGKKYSFLNFGVGAYNTRQEWLTYKHRAKPYKPKLVIVQFLLNDMVWTYPFAVNQSVASRAKEFMREHFYTYNFFTFIKRSIRGDTSIKQAGIKDADPKAMPLSVEFVRPLYDPKGKFYRDWEQDAKRFGRLRRDGVKVLFVIFPWSMYVGIEKGAPYPYYEFHRQVEETLRREGIPYVDVTPVLEARGGLKRYWLNGGDYHLNAEAHEIVAKLLSPKVEDILKENGANGGVTKTEH